MRLRLTPDITDGVIEVGVELFPEGEDEPWEMGELNFSIAEWTEFVQWATNNGTSLNFDILDGTKDLVIL